MSMTMEQLESRVRQHLRRQAEDSPKSIASAGNVPAGEIPDFVVEDFAKMIVAILPEIIEEVRN